MLQGLVGTGALATASNGAAELLQASGTTDVVVRAEEVDVPLASSDDAVDELKAEAREAQRPIVDYVRDTDGLSVKNRFWLANALLLEVDTDEFDLEELASQDGVAEIHDNFVMEIPEPQSASASSSETTYGLDQVDATRVWDQFGARGDGARIAVLDTGVDADHPDIDVDPGNFAEFDENGEVVDSEPHDSHYHGTHVSGTVVGAAEPDGDVPAFGVAPEATLLNGLVLPSGGGTFAQIMGGMQWAVENDADAINMSLGVIGYVGEMIEPVRNAERAGTLVVSSSGNSGDGTSGSPANVYDSVAVGASNEAEEITEFSSGDTVSTENAWGYLAPDEWPDSYVVPDVSAPGNDVTSAFPLDDSDGPYNAISGTSMASPHVAGVVGLIESAAVEETGVDRTKAALATTAWKPGGEPAEPDTRYGRGIVDAYAAAGRFAAESGVEGTVTDADGEPIAGATVDLDGFPTETDADGGYRLRAIAGTYEVTADAFGYAPDAATVEVGDGFATADFTLSDSLAAAVVGTQPEGLQAGESIEVTLNVAHAESIRVERAGDYAGGAALAVDGEPAEFGETVAFDSARSDELTVTVATADDGLGDLALEHTLEGLGDQVTVSTGPTSVFEQPAPIGIVDAGSGFGADVEAILAEQMHPRYQFSQLDPADALAAARNREHEGYVVQNLGDDEELVADFVEEATAPEVGVVYLDQYGEESDAVSQVSDATGDPRETFDALVELQLPLVVPIQYAVDQAHPVMDGIVEEGEAVTVTEPDPVQIGLFLSVAGFHTYFEEYSGGVAGATLADTSIGITDTGSGLAVDDISRVVFASSLGVSTLVDRSAFTLDGQRLLGNLVSHAATTPPIDVASAPPELSAPGETATAEIEIEELVELEVDAAGLRFIETDELTLSVDGEQQPLGEPIRYDEPVDGTVELAIEAPDAVGEFAFDTRFVTLGRHEREVETTATFRPTTVYESPLRVPDQLEDLQAAVDFVLPGDEVVVGDGTYEADAPDRGFQTGLFVDTPGMTLRAAEGATPEVVHARDLPAPRAIHIDADDVTLDGIDANVIDGEVDEKNFIGTGVLVADGTSGVTVRNLTAAGTFGVQLESTSELTVENVTAIESITGVGTDSGFFGEVVDATIRNVTVRDSPEYSFSGGVVVGSGASRITVTDCDIEIESGDIGGVVLAGPFGGGEDCRVADNTIVGNDVEEVDLTWGIEAAGVLVDSVEAVVEGNEATGVGIGVHVGDRLGFGDEDVVVRDNRIRSEAFGYRQTGDFATVERNDIVAETGIQLGEDPDASFPSQIEADRALVRFNDLSATAVPFAGEPDEPWFPDPDVPLIFDCRENYLGDRGYDDTIADGDIVYDPYLTEPPAELDSVAAGELTAAADAHPTEIATDLYLDAGGSYGLGVPGPTDLTIYEMLGADGHKEFPGEIEFWNHDSGNWQRVTGNGDLKYADSLYAFRVTPAEGVRAELHFQRADDPPVGPDGTPPGHRDAEPGRSRLQAGWNFVAAPQYGAAGEVFDSPAIDEVDDALHSPGRQLGETEKRAFTGYKVHATEATWLAAGLDAYDPTMPQLYEGLGLDPEIHDDPGASAATARPRDVTAAELVEAAPDDETARAAVAELVGHRIAAEVDPDADDPAAILEQVGAAVDATAAEAPDDEDGADVVEAGARDAVRAAIKRRFGTEIRDEDGEPLADRGADTERARTEAGGARTTADD